MNRKSLLLAVLILAVCGVGVMLVAGPATRQTPPASLNGVVGQVSAVPLGPVPLQPLPDTSVPHSPWEGPTVITSETPLPPQPTLPLAPMLPGSGLVAQQESSVPQLPPK